MKRDRAWESTRVGIEGSGQIELEQALLDRSDRFQIHSEAGRVCVGNDATMTAGAGRAINVEIFERIALNASQFHSLCGPARKAT